MTLCFVSEICALENARFSFVVPSPEKLADAEKNALVWGDFWLGPYFYNCRIAHMTLQRLTYTSLPEFMTVSSVALHIFKRNMVD